MSQQQPAAVKTASGSLVTWLKDATASRSPSKSPNGSPQRTPIDSRSSSKSSNRSLQRRLVETADPNTAQMVFAAAEAPATTIEDALDAELSASTQSTVVASAAAINYLCFATATEPKPAVVLARTETTQTDTHEETATEQVENQSVDNELTDQAEAAPLARTTTDKEIEDVRLKLQMLASNVLASKLEEAKVALAADSAVKVEEGEEEEEAAHEDAVVRTLTLKENVQGKQLRPAWRPGQGRVRQHLRNAMCFGRGVGRVC